MWLQADRTRGGGVKAHPVIPLIHGPSCCIEHAAQHLRLMCATQQALRAVDITWR